MGSYLEGYGAGEEERARLIKRLLALAGVFGILALGGYFLFRDYREKRQADHFIELLRARQYEAAYALWGCSKEKPCPDYNFDKFLEDWGPQSPHADLGKMKIARTQHCASGIIRTLEWSPSDKVPLWVNRGDLQLSFAPWPVCDFRFQMPIK